MKHRIRNITLVVLVLLAALTIFASAQTTILYARFHAPFAYDVDTRHMPPGDYILTLSSGNLLTVSSSDGAALAVVHVIYEPRRVNASEAVFNTYGDRYFMREVTIHGRGTHIFLPESATERLSAQQWAMAELNPSRSTLALLSEPR